MIAAYFRVSTDKQDEGMQIEAVKTLADSMNISWQDVKLFCDHGISGRTTEREQYKELMGLVTEGRIKQLLIYDYSRVWRNIEEQAKAVTLLLNHDVSVYAAHGGNLQTPDDKLHVNLQGVINEYEADKFAQRRRDGIDNKIPKCTEIMLKATREGWSLEQLLEHPDYWNGRGKDRKPRSTKL